MRVWVNPVNVKELTRALLTLCSPRAQMNVSTYRQTELLTQRRSHKTRVS